MLAITDEALAQLERLLDDLEAPGGAAIRIIHTQEREMAFALDDPTEVDRVVARGQRPVLLVAPDVDRVLEGITLEVGQTETGPRLVLVRPDAQSPEK